MTDYNLKNDDAYGRNVKIKENDELKMSAWEPEFWQNSTWEDFFTGERDAFLFHENHEMTKEVKKIREILLTIKNMQNEVQIGNKKEIEFLAMLILLDGYSALETEKKSSLDLTYYENILFPYGMASSAIGYHWYLKRRDFIVDIIKHYLRNNYHDDKSNYYIRELREFAAGEVNLEYWDIQFIKMEFPTIYISEKEHSEIQETIVSLSELINLGKEFYTKVHNIDKMRKEQSSNNSFQFIKRGAVIPDSSLIYHSGRKVAEEAELEDAMLSILKEKFISKKVEEKEAEEMRGKKITENRNKNNERLKDIFALILTNKNTAK